MPEKPRAPSSWVRLSSIGFEVAATVVGFTLVGYWFDRHFKSAPWGLLVGFILGLTGGLYNLVRETVRAGRGTTGDDGDRKR